MTATSARDRILLAADRLFYDEGVRGVGVDRVVAESDVSRMTFYRHFPAKDDLVVAYVGRQLDRDTARLRALQDAHPDDPRRVLLDIGDHLFRDAAQRGFRGCPYSNIAVEYFQTDHPVRHAAVQHRAWLKAEVSELLLGAGHRDPALAAEQLLMLRAGAMAIAGNNGWEKPMWDEFVSSARAHCRTYSSLFSSASPRTSAQSSARGPATA